MNLLLSVIGLALATLRENKVRSFLTLLGVMIGTGTIIGVGSILTGLDGAVTGAIRSLGTNTAIVMKIGPSFGGGRTPEQRMRRPLTYDNVLAIEERCPSVEHVSPILQPPNGILRARYKGNDAFQLQMFGTSEYYATAGQADLMAGRFFTDSEDRHRMPVTVIGQDI
jgi:putative ABC transport system permease protein